VGRIIGTVVDVNGDPVPNAKVELRSSLGDDPRRLVTQENGFFEFQDVTPRVSYEISIAVQDFAAWTPPAIMLEPGQFKIVTGIQLRIATQRTTVDVRYDAVEVATEQLKIEEMQRVFGIIPNFYVTYEKDAAPLTPKMKFQLALKVSYDPVTIAGVLGMASIRQSANSPNLRTGLGVVWRTTRRCCRPWFWRHHDWRRRTANAHPRYFYQVTGTTSSRVRHALFSPFVTRNDNGTWGPNYSSLGGDLGSAALSNLWYPKSNRGLGLVFGDFALGTAERMGASLAQEIPSKVRAVFLPSGPG
jgi:Carboxypeptidase regulatory-like domain